MIDFEREFLEACPRGEASLGVLRDAVTAIVQTHHSGGLVMVCGNGGSAADSGHIVGELLKAFRATRPVTSDRVGDVAADFDAEDTALLERLQDGIRAVSLPCATSAMSAIGNDCGYDMVFAQQVWALGRPGDVLIALSTSGKSANILNAMKVAKWRGCTTIGLTGQAANPMDKHSDMIFHAPAEPTHRVQEFHLAFYHALCGMVEQAIFG